MVTNKSPEDLIRRIVQKEINKMVKEKAKKQTAEPSA